MPRSSLRTWWSVPGPRGPDGLLAVVVLVATQAELLYRGTGDLPTAPVALSAGVIAAAVAWRRPYAMGVAVVVVGGNLALLFAGLDMDNLGLFVATLLSAWSMGSHTRGWAARPVVTMAWLACVATGAFLVIEASEAAGLVVLVSAATLLGRLLRSRERTVVDLMAEARRLDEQREERARVAVQEERTRIARELHDVVAHAVSLMVLQTGAGRKALRSSPDRAEAMLTSAEETGRQALAEMKRLVGIMRAGAPALDPQPGLGQLETLVEGARASGKRVELQVTGGPAELAPGVDLAAFRIVQEALTNSIKHAGPAPARVLVDYRTDEVVVEVTDDGLPGALHWPPAEPGHGLAGMRERTNLYDGSLEVGPDPAGGLRVRATLPVEPS